MKDFILTIRQKVNELRKQINTVRTFAKGTLLFCPHCNSPCISHSVETKRKTHNLDSGELLEETYYVRCENCKSKGQVIEYWVLNKDDDSSL